MAGARLTESILGSGRPRIVRSLVVCQGSSTVCSTVADTLRGLIDDCLTGDDPDDPASRRFLIGEVENTDGVADWVDVALRKAATPEHWERLEALGEVNNVARADGNNLPQLYLVLEAALLAEGESRDELGLLLREVGQRAGALTVVFLESTRETGGVSDLDRETVACWMAAFDKQPPCRLAMYLAQPFLDGGQPVRFESIAVGTAIMLLADMVLDGEMAETERLLTYDAGSALTTLGTFGVRSMWYSPTSHARIHGERFAAEVLRTTFGPDGMVNAEPVPALRPPLIEIVDSAIIQALGKRGTLRLVSGATELKSLQQEPRFTGTDARRMQPYAATVDIRQGGFSLDLDAVPMHDWQQAVYTWDFLHRREVVGLWLEGLPAAFDRAAERTLPDVTDAITRAIRNLCGLRKLQEQVDTERRGLEEEQTIRVDAGRTPNLGAALASLHRALQRIPNIPSLVVRAAIVLLVQLAVGLAVYHGALPYKGAFLGALGLLALLTVVVSIWLRMARVKQAFDARNRAVADIGRRSSLAACHMCADCLRDYLGRVRAHLELAAKMIQALRDEIRLVTEQLPTGQCDLDRDAVHLLVPSKSRVDDIVQKAREEELRLDGPRGRAIELLADSAASLFAKSMASGDYCAGHLLDNLRRTAETRLARYFRRCTLRTFVDHERENPTPGSHEFDLRNLIDAGPYDRLYATGPFVRDRIAAAANCERLCAPRTFVGLQTGNESLPVQHWPLENVLARVALVELWRPSDPAEGDRAA